MPERVIIFGIGAQTRIVQEILAVSGHYQAERIISLDSAIPPEAQKYQVPIQAWDENQLKSWQREGLRKAIVAHRDNRKRAEFISKVLDLGFELINVIHPRACVAGNTRLGHNVLINANAVIQPFAQIGHGVVVHSMVNIGHDNAIGDYVNLATGATLAGWVQVLEGAYIYINAAVFNRCKIGRHAVVGAGAVVMQDVPDYAVVMGNPARVKWVKHQT